MKQFNAIQKLGIIMLVLLPLTVLNSTIIGKWRVSAYKINDDGSFSYDVTIRVQNDAGYPTTYTNYWSCYIDDVSKIYSENIEWTGSWTPFQEVPPFDPSIIRSGFRRYFNVNFQPYEEKVYRLGYTGPAGFWNFGNYEGVFYGDGTGGAETSFEYFFVDVQLPPTAQNFNVFNESSPHYLVSQNPFKLRWIENYVTTVTCWVTFSGGNLTVNDPIIWIQNVTPTNPSIFSNITLSGKIVFPNGTTYNPGLIGIEDPLALMSTTINVNNDGTFQYATHANSYAVEGPLLFKLFFTYNTRTIVNNFILPLQDYQSNYDIYYDNFYSTTAFNHTSELPGNINVFSYRTGNTAPPTEAEVSEVSGRASVNLQSYAKATWKDYWDSPTNKVVLGVTALSCATSWTNPISASACVWGVKTVAVGISKSAFFVGADKFIDEIPDEELSDFKKEELKLNIRAVTHISTSFLTLGPDGGLKPENYASAAVLAGKLTENQYQYSKLIYMNESSTGATIPDLVIQAVDQDGNVWNMCIADQSQNSIVITSHSPVDLVVTDGFGRSISKNQTNIPGAVYYEGDLNGDGDTDDRVTINGYSLETFSIQLLPEIQSFPTDSVTLTLNAPWLDSTRFIFTNRKIEEIANQVFTFNTEFIPEQLVENLIDSVISLKNTGILNQGEAISLTSKLESALSKIVQSQINVAINKIEAFKNEINAFQNSNRLTTEQAGYLLIAADNIIFELTHLVKAAEQSNESNETILNKYYLEQNYPNPFNPYTTIEYNIPENCFVSLKIYDALGNEVAELVNETKQPGKYTAEFYANNLASGIYIYKLTANKFILAKKMILMK